MRSLILASTLLILCGASALSAQPNCRKGKPCGNTCIAQNRTCRIAPAGESPSRHPAPDTGRASARGLLAAPVGTMRDDSLRAQLLPWIAVEDRRVYYASACAGASGIPFAQRRYFRAEETLQRIGYRRAEVAAEGCTLDQLQEHERRLLLARP